MLGDDVAPRFRHSVLDAPSGGQAGRFGRLRARAFAGTGLAQVDVLYAGDYPSNLQASRGVLAAEEGEEAADADVDVDEEPRREATGPIEEMLNRNQHVLVQVSKESLGTKGARITS